MSGNGTCRSLGNDWSVAAARDGGIGVTIVTELGPALLRIALLGYPSRLGPGAKRRRGASASSTRREGARPTPPGASGSSTSPDEFLATMVEVTRPTVHQAKETLMAYQFA